MTKKAMNLTTSPHHITKSPDSDTDTETPLQTHLTKALSLTNGSYKTHQNHYFPPPPQQHVVVSYKECLKNHAASFGGLALDGCGEFMPKPTAAPRDPTSLKCAACGCHRNFHRRESFGPTTTTRMPLPPAFNWTTSPSQSPGSTSSGPSPSPSSPASPPSPIPQSFYPSAPHRLLALSAAHSGHPDDTQLQKQSHSPAMTNPHGKKRARTKFSQEQKEKMYLFAEKLGWRMLRGNNDRVVEEFCSEIGVARNVFKVWMHNNRSRKEKVNDRYGLNSSNKCGFNADEEAAGRVGTDNKGYSFNNDNNGNNYDSFDRYQIETKVHVHDSMTPRGSSTSP